MRILSAGIAGALFGFGLSLSEMVDPERVAGFLDPFGSWDPTLALVMTGALTVTFVAFRLVLRRPKPFFGETFAVPTTREVDLALIGGAAIFGVGWGLSGFCPGPAIAGLAFGIPDVLVFVASMLAGMTAFELWRSWKTAPRSDRDAHRRSQKLAPYADA